MTVSINSEVEVIDMAHLEPRLKKDNDRRRRRRCEKNNRNSSDDSSCSTTSTAVLSSSDNDSSSTELQLASPKSSKQQRSNGANRRGGKNNAKKNNGRKNKKGGQGDAEETLSMQEQAKYVALDCEMVGVGYRGRYSSVARVTLVGWDGRILLDKLIKQTQEVTDYRTFVSGITAEDLEDSEEKALISLEECQQLVQDILKEKVLIGHALKNDLKALGISHPWFMTRDTAKYEPFMQVRFDDGVLWPRKLKDLVKNKLQRDIQKPGQAHSPIEDAMGALDLYRKVRGKWEKAIEYKLKKTQEIQKN